MTQDPAARTKIPLAQPKPEPMVLSGGVSKRHSRTLALQDRQMRLWDLRTNVCQGLLQAPARPCAAFDQQVSPQEPSP